MELVIRETGDSEMRLIAKKLHLNKCKNQKITWTS